MVQDNYITSVIGGTVSRVAISAKQAIIKVYHMSAVPLIHIATHVAIYAYVRTLSPLTYVHIYIHYLHRYIRA